MTSADRPSIPASKRRRTIFISGGSNIRPEKNVPACIRMLKKKFHVKKISSIYETKPVGPAGNRNFWNFVIEIESDQEKKKLISALRRVEKKLGRKRSRSSKFIPRTIDLDLLPQPDYQKQAFIMIPLAEIAPSTRDKISGKSFRAIAKSLLRKDRPLKKISFSEVAP